MGSINTGDEPDPVFQLLDTSRVLPQQVAAEPPAPGDHNATLHQMVADLQRRLDSETRRSAVLDDRLAGAKTAIAEERSAWMNAERENHVLRRELEVVESSMRAARDAGTSAAPSRPRLNGVTLLYVGGRPHHVAQLRAIAEDAVPPSCTTTVASSTI